MLLILTVVADTFKRPLIMITPNSTQFCILTHTLKTSQDTYMDVGKISGVGQPSSLAGLIDQLWFHSIYLIKCCIFFFAWNNIHYLLHYFALILSTSTQVGCDVTSMQWCNNMRTPSALTEGSSMPPCWGDNGDVLKVKPQVPIASESHRG